MTKSKIDVSTMSQRERQDLLDTLWRTSDFEEVIPTAEEAQRLDAAVQTDLEDHYRHLTQLLKTACADANIAVPEQASLVECFRLLRQSHPSFVVSGQTASAIDRIQQSLGDVVSALATIRQDSTNSGQSPPPLEEPEVMFAVRTLGALSGYLMSRLNRS
jgi:hypothetical protein